MAGRQSEDNWSLGDLADLERLLAEKDAARGAKRIYRERIADQLEQVSDEGERRRRGLLLWLQEKRGDQELVGERLESGLRFAGLAVAVVMFLSGVGVVRGLLVEMPGGGGRGYNVWLLLGVMLGLQWLLLLGGLVGTLVWRRHGGLSIGAELISLLGRKIAGSRAGDVWRQLLKTRAKGYGSVLGWRLGSLSQMGAEWFNIGLLIGFLGCLLFLKVGYYWESTLDLDARSLEGVTQALSLPWFFYPRAIPEKTDVMAIAIDAPEALRASASAIWTGFFLLAILVWGLLPRVIFYVFCKWKEKRALTALDFQESRHRSLWREMARIERAVVKTGQEDGVVLLDVGGTGLKVASIRPFLLQKMRVNPEGLHQTGVLDAEKERQAIEAMQKAALGVVLVVEGWNLSKPEMKANYEKVRRAVGESKPIRFLVVGSVRNGGVNEVGDVEFGEWEAFVDSLRDPAVEVVRWEG
ncbi:MAG: DUF2868 domain-containing protein [Verrucomicrobiota bacterium JB023]|nr:DUF2868 domain-containing protein [Verrucomicrobiota bacterium JB023]